MLKLDNSLLEQIGLGQLTEDQKKAMLQHIYETLELRVGTNLANQMTDQQLEEFEKFIDDGGDASQAQALQWLEANLPHYKQVVNQVFEELKLEVSQMAPQILASSMPAAGASAQQQMQAPAPMVQPGYDPHAFDAAAQGQQGRGSSAGQYQQPQPMQPTGYAPNGFGTPAGPAPAGVPAAMPPQQSGYQGGMPTQQSATVQGDDPYGFAMAAGAGVPPQSDPLAGYGQSAAAPTVHPANDQYGRPFDVPGASQQQAGQTQNQSQQSAPQYPPQQPPAGPGSYDQGQSGQQYPY